MKVLAGESAAFADGMQWQVMWDVVIASRYDLLMLVMALAGYVILFHSRSRWRAAGEQKHVQQKDKELEWSPSITVEPDKQKHESLSATAEAKSQCSDATYILQMKLAAASRPQTQAIMQEVLDRPIGLTFSFDLVLSILGFCRMSPSDRPVVDSLLLRIDTRDVDILSEFIQFYIDSSQPEKACAVFELNQAVLEGELGQDTEWTLMNAALKCGRLSLASHFFESSHEDATKSMLKIQRWWKRAAVGAGTDSRERQVSDVFGRLALVFNERFPFEEDSNVDSNDESTAFFGDDDDRHDSDFDSDYDGNNWTVDY